MTQQTCKACGTTLYGKFCHECGEKIFNKKDLTFKEIFLQGVYVFTHLDSKIFKSIKALITKPGFLAQEYCSGIKGKYAKPLQLFVLINVVYFLLLSLGFFNTFNTPLYVHMTGTKHSDVAKSMVEKQIAKKNISAEEYQKKFDARVNVLSRTLIIVFAPIFAFGLFLLFINRRMLYMESVIFSLNFLSWLLLFKILVESPLTLLVQFLNKSFENKFAFFTSDEFMSMLLFTAIGVYAFFAVQRFYHEKRWVSLFKAILIPYIFLYSLHIYRFILFLVTFYTT